MINWIKNSLFFLLLLLFWIPLLQQLTNYFEEAKLKGAFIVPPTPVFSFDSIKNSAFQKQVEDYENFNFGFRPFLLQLKNSVEYVLFKKLNAPDIIEGQDGYIYSMSSIDFASGKYYDGKEKNEATIEKIKKLETSLKKRGAILLTIFAPSKESVYPEYLPAIYSYEYKNQTNYFDFINGYTKNNLSFIDFCSYFRKIKDTCGYPLFTKTGFHWSNYGASIAQDTIVNYLKNRIPKEIPSYSFLGVEWLDTAQQSDTDLEGPLNLLFDLNRPHFAYPKLKTEKNSIKKHRPKIIIIGDSFFSQVKNLNILKDVFSEDSKFWYYFTTSFALGSAEGEPVKNLNVIQEIESADIVLLTGSIGTLTSFPFGVTDYYDSFFHHPILDALIEQKKNMNTQKEENSILNEANAIFNNKTTFQLKAMNNKYVCADGSKNSIVIADRDAAYAWETFSLLKLAENKCAISSYDNKFLSAEIGTNAEITATRTKIMAWETFELIELDKNHVAFKAANNNYLSINEKTGQLYANAGSIGKNERFEIVQNLDR